VRRRRFLAAAGASLAAAGFAAGAVGTAVATPRRAARPLRILMLGGTRFIGIHMTRLALARGHEVTHFTRGRSGQGLFPTVRQLNGDRNGQLDALRDGEWDAVIDNSGYVPRQVHLAAELLAPRVRQYVFISSISVYPDFSVPRAEDAPVGKLDDESVEKVDGATYGPLKALCEQAAQRIFVDRTTILRPGLIVGPEDNTDRFTYWPARAARGGEFIAPVGPREGVQVIDARDLAAFTLRCIERATIGVFNIVSAPGQFTIGDVVAASVRAARRLAKPAMPPQPVWLPLEFLDAQKIAGWSDLPVWSASRDGEAAFAATPVRRALAAGLEVRPMRATVDDTLAWHLARPAAQREALKAGISAEREAAALAAWRESSAKRPGAAARIAGHETLDVAS
jgi:2'-hydroxyisoflavone reductase